MYSIETWGEKGKGSLPWCRWLLSARRRSHLRKEKESVTGVKKGQGKSLYAKSNQFFFARPSLSHRAEIPQPLNSKKKNACWLLRCQKTTPAPNTSIDRDRLWRRDVGNRQSPRDCGTEPSKLGSQDRWGRAPMVSGPRCHDQLEVVLAPALLMRVRGNGKSSDK